MAEYIVLENGDVINKKTKRKLKYFYSKGYAYISMSTNSCKKRYSIHRLVATTYIPNPHNKPQIDHIDGNKLNNHYTNLRWCTNEENQNFREYQNNSGKDSSNIAKKILYNETVYNSIYQLSKHISDKNNITFKNVDKRIRVAIQTNKKIYGYYATII